MSTRELANAIDRIVVVDAQHVASIRRKRIRLCQQLQRAGGVGGKDGVVFVRRSVEIVQNLRARFLHQAGHGE
jgi:hypothetical protein